VTFLRGDDHSAPVPGLRLEDGIAADDFLHGLLLEVVCSLVERDQEIDITGGTTRRISSETHRRRRRLSIGCRLPAISFD
jgi:hypothetical protein